MRHLIISFALHHANRSVRDIFSWEEEYVKKFYAIKDRILKIFGKQQGYQIQHIPGKTCNSCGGSGQHAKYSMYPPYKIYDYADCYHCMGGWYRLPQWICLAVVKFGKYSFHQPLKREYRVDNPFTKDNMGWDVSQREVIKGYVEHESTSFGIYALLILFLVYDRKAFQFLFKKWKRRLYWKFEKYVNWRTYIIDKPKPFHRHWFDASGQGHEIEDLPF